MASLLPRLRTIVLVISGLLVFGGAKAQYVAIPDPHFAAYLRQQYSTCMNGSLLDTACAHKFRPSMINAAHDTLSDISGVQYFDSLTAMNVSNNLLTFLPPLPKRITQILAWENKLTSLPALPDSLLFLEVSHNQIISLPILPPKLTSLYCNYNGTITSLPALPSTLRSLSCAQNKLTVIPALPLGVTSIDCSNNRLTSLPTLPSQLTYLDCGGNNLATLPPLNDSLTSLEADYNDLTSIAAFPPKLRIINLRNNKLISVPAFPPIFINTLDLGGNQLTEIPALPDSVDLFYCDGNPKLTCLPRLTKMDRLSFENTAVSCIPNYITIKSYCKPALSSLPLCTMFSSSGCHAYGNISGQTFWNDGTENNRLQPNIKVQLWSNGTLQQQTYTNDYGQYDFKAGPGNYEVRIDSSGLPVSINSPPGNVYYLTITATDSVSFNNNFGIKCKPASTFDIGVANIDARFRPAGARQATIMAGDMAVINKTQCASNISIPATVVATISGPASFTSVAPGALPASLTGGNTLIWTVPDLRASGQGSFDVMVATDTTAIIGAVVCIKVVVATARNGDADLTNDTLIKCFIVRSSYDPNDKSVSPIGNTDPATKWLTYTVRFQNTGTDTAQHIYVLDTLDANVDASTFQLLDYSHKPMLAQILEGGIARFNFPNINLPDSNVNEKASHGYVLYRVAPKRNLPLGTQIRNTAYIYFDFNEPVVTNITLNTITQEVATAVSPLYFGEGLEVRLFPNPATQQLNILCTGFVPQHISISDVNGRKVSEQHYNRQVDVSYLAPGVYFVEVQGEGNQVRRKFVKE